MENQTPLSNREPGPWVEVSYLDGIRIVEIPTFEAFFQFLQIGFGGSTDHSLSWRGQRCAEWEITSSLARVSKSEDWAHIFRYREAVARCTNVEFEIQNSDKDSEELKLWALGQHHGLKTPLIDWTKYPYVALFFAFAEPQASTCGRRAVFALNFHETASLNFNITETHGMAPFKQKLSKTPYTDDFRRYILEEIGVPDQIRKMVEESKISDAVKEWLCDNEYQRLKKKQLRFYTPSTKENQRIHSQGGSLVYTPGNVPVETWIRTYNELRPPPWDQIPLLTKVIIPETERKAILKGLNKMNINYLTLFPDLGGAAQYCNMLLTEGRELGLKSI
ncbi:FRG domain-containing protein [Pedosphaera parvula]|uniref:FRG domain protein n=1 Tax=Pedosphaera parvula (strain Ellin514) TaxID=320771 RepID=B9XEP5_PEDPL|nr:FRG domain-containing protein [Pedosphaera parvula]EEF61759.1 FRG domain protein [Pedosphaera parvula Ellin514]